MSQKWHAGLSRHTWCGAAPVSHVTTRATCHAPTRRAAGKKAADQAEKDELEAGALVKIQAAIEAGKGARTAQLNKDEAAAVKVRACGVHVGWFR